MEKLIDDILCFGQGKFFLPPLPDALAREDGHFALTIGADGQQRLGGRHTAHALVEDHFAARHQAILAERHRQRREFRQNVQPLVVQIQELKRGVEHPRHLVELARIGGNLHRAVQRIDRANSRLISQNEKQRRVLRHQPPYELVAEARGVGYLVKNEEVVGFVGQVVEVGGGRQQFDVEFVIFVLLDDAAQRFDIRVRGQAQQQDFLTSVDDVDIDLTAVVAGAGFAGSTAYFHSIMLDALLVGRGGESERLEIIVAVQHHVLGSHYPPSLPQRERGAPPGQAVGHHVHLNRKLVAHVSHAVGRDVAQ